MIKKYFVRICTPILICLFIVISGSNIKAINKYNKNNIFFNATDSTKIIYVDGSTNESDNSISGDGSENNPYLGLNTAIANASNGDVIKFKSNYVYRTESQGIFTLNKNLIFDGNGNTLTMRANELRLEKGATFKNVNLRINDDGAKGAKIYAYGNTLTLDGVSTEMDGTRPTIYGGSVDGNNLGTKTIITLLNSKDNQKTFLNKIVGGNFEGNSSIPVEINIDSNAKVDNIVLGGDESVVNSKAQLNLSSKYFRSIDVRNASDNVLNFNFNKTGNVLVDGTIKDLHIKNTSDISFNELHISNNLTIDRDSTLRLLNNFAEDGNIFSESFNNISGDGTFIMGHNFRLTLKQNLNDSIKFKVDGNLTGLKVDTIYLTVNGVVSSNAIVELNNASSSDTKHLVREGNSYILKEKDNSSNINNDLINGKQIAKDEILEVVKIKILKINEDNKTTQEEKNEAIEAINNFKEDAINAIDNSDNLDEISVFKNEAITLINKVEAPSLVKKAAIKEVNRIADEKISSFDAIANITSSEISDATTKVNEAKIIARNQILNALTNEEVKVAKQKAIEIITNINSKVIKKDNVKAEILEFANNKKQINNNNTDATSEEISMANEKIDQIIKQANDSIDNTKDDAAIDDIKNTTIISIRSTIPDVSYKNEAKKDVDNILKIKIDELNKDKESTKEEKQDFELKLQELSEVIKGDISAAKSKQDVLDVKTKGIESINNYILKPNVKKTTIIEINKKAKDRIFEIRNNNSLTNEEKEKLVMKINEVTNEIILNISNTTTNKEVEEIKTNGIKSLDEVFKNKAVEPIEINKPSTKIVLNGKVKLPKAGSNSLDLTIPSIILLMTGVYLFFKNNYIKASK